MLDKILYVLTTILLLFCSAFFSACETAITAYSKPKMFRVAKEGNKKAQVILELQKEIEIVRKEIVQASNKTLLLMA